MDAIGGFARAAIQNKSPIQSDRTNRGEIPEPNTGGLPHVINGDSVDIITNQSGIKKACQFDSLSQSQLQFGVVNHHQGTARRVNPVLSETSHRV